MAQMTYNSINESTIYNPGSYPPPSGLPPFGHRRFSSQKHKSKRSFSATNTFPHRHNKDLKNTNNNNIRQQADIIRYIAGKDAIEPIEYSQTDLDRKLYFHNVFTPDVHSTPIHRHKEYSPKTQQNDEECNRNNNMYDFELYKYPDEIPTVSKYVDRNNSSNNNTNSTQGTVTKRWGLTGVSWILSLALKDTTAGKIFTRKIGCLFSIIIIFALGGGLLLYYSSHFTTKINIPYTNFTSATRPRTGDDDGNSTSIDSFLVKNVNLSDVSLSTISYIITSPMESQTSSSEEQIDNKTENVWRNTSSQNIITRNEDYTHLLMEYCKSCRKGLDVCIASAENGIPVCKAASDMRDPTGCGGLCALEIEACQLLDRKLSIYTCKSVVPLSMCKPDEWRCQNSLCVHKDKRCDGQMDCYDQSDEFNCPCNSAEAFRCGQDTSCLPNSKRCDSIMDCWDGSDELNCTIPLICPDDQFTCNNGECITQVRFCDGYSDCSDGSDEPNGCGGDCISNEFRCANDRCIFQGVTCNGVDDCGDMSDELNCPHVKAT